MGYLLLVSGSLRAGSTNTAVLRTVQQLAPPSLGPRLYHGLGLLPAFNPDLTEHPPPAVGALYETVHRARSLLFCVPEYAGALPGAVKNLLDWLIPDPAQGSIYAKPVAWINSSPRGARGAHAELETVLGYAHARILTEACVELPVTSAMVDPSGTIANPAVRARIKEVLGALLSEQEPGRPQASTAPAGRPDGTSP